jgi:beta-glucosidase-like glycosyl hydrolase
MAARKSARELIGLADKLLESDKFSPWYKPYCFADYVTACTERVGVSALEDLLVALKNAWVGDIIRSVYQDDADQVVCALVRRVVEASNKDEAVERRLTLMIFAGLVKNPEHAIELALDAGLPADVESRLRDALARLAARPVDNSCPF